MNQKSYIDSREVKNLGIKSFEQSQVDREISVLNADGKIVRTNLYRDYVALKNKTYWEAHIKALFDTWEYEAHGSDCFRRGCYIEKGDVVLDIGANLGIFAIRANCHEPSKIICFEPMHENFLCLLDNKSDNMDCYNIAVGQRTSIQNLTIHTDFTHSGGASLEVHFEDHGLKTVKNQNVITLNMDYMFDNGLLPGKIDFMKMDIEGAEFGVLHGLSDENLLKIRKVNIEFHTDTDDERTKAAIQRFIDLGYQTFVHWYTGGQQQLNAWKE